MAFSLLINLSLASFFILIAALLLTMKVLRHSSAAARHLIWTAATLCILCLPAFTFLPAPADVPTPLAPIPILTALFPLPTFTPSSSSLRPVSTSLSLPMVLLSAYLVGVFIFLIPLLVSPYLLFRLRRQASPATDESLFSTLESCRCTVRINHPTHLLISRSSTAMPLTFGLFRSYILLPSTASTWSSERLRLVLSHELAHIKRRDCLTDVLAQISRALQWFNPLSHLALLSMRTERERACDDLVLRSTTAHPSDYAAELLHLTSLCRPFQSFITATPMARPSQLHARLRAILDPALNRSPLTRRLTIAVLLIAPMLSLPLACTHHTQDGPSRHFDLGDSSFLAGDSITISQIIEISPPKSDLSLSRTFQVAGTCTLASHDAALLGAEITSNDPKSGKGGYTRINKGSAQPFSLTFTLAGNGYPHVSFYPPNGGESFGGIYFGSGATLLNHNQGFSQNDPAPAGKEHLIVRTVGPAGQHFIATLSVDGKPQDFNGTSPAELTLDCHTLSGSIRRSSPIAPLSFEIVGHNRQCSFGAGTPFTRFKYENGTLVAQNAP